MSYSINLDEAKRCVFLTHEGETSARGAEAARQEANAVRWQVWTALLVYVAAL